MIEKNGSIGNQTMLTNGKKTDELIQKNLLTHFNIVGSVPALAIARFNNTIQKLAENTRLGIPITLSTDPRHSTRQSDVLTSANSGDFSPFPEPIGFGAIGDTVMVKKFAQLAAKEYRAVGLSCALHPMADLATEPRWARITGTFGEDPYKVATLIQAYIAGFQGKALTNKSVMCITKHFPGSGPQQEGWEGHFSYGRNLVYPGNNLEGHLLPFQAAIQSGTAGIMTAYGIPVGKTNEEIGVSFNRQMLQDLLRVKLAFNGIIISDWNTITAKYIGSNQLFEARGWGAEHLTIKQKLVKQVLAGVDQIGGEFETDSLYAVIKEGLIPEEVINASVLKILTLKFQLGLFDNPYVEEAEVVKQVGLAASVQLGIEAQQKSLVLLKNELKTLPLSKNAKIYVQGFNKQVAKNFGLVVENLDSCDYAIIHLGTPFSPPKSNSMLENYIRQGTLDYDSATVNKVGAIMKVKPTILVCNLERPAILTAFNPLAKVILVDFKVSDEVVFSTLFGQTPPSGKLPFELPSSMQAVVQQKEDMSHDSKQPLYQIGFGLMGY
jgi:beta-glucosidase